VLWNLKICQYFSESISKILSLKIESFRNFAAILEIVEKCNFKMLTKLKILERIVYVISQLICLWSRKFAQGGGEILPKVLPQVSAKFCQNFITWFKMSPKPQH